jgi:hypothetical protein
VSFVSDIVAHCFPLNRNQPVGAIDGAEATDGEGPDEFLRGDVALAAVLLDAVGASPADFARGVHVIYAPRPLFDGVKRVIAKTSGIEFCDNRTYRRPANAAWVTGIFDEPTIIAGLQAKATLIGVVASEADLPSGFAAVADRVWSTPWVERARIEAAIRLMTGEAAPLPDRPYDLSSVLKALRPGVAAAKVVADLKALHEKQWDDDGRNASSAAAELAEPTDAGDKADAGHSAGQPGEPAHGAAAETVTRLRDLAGFGPAKDWGLQLAADLAEYKAGRLGWEDVDKGLLLSGPPGCGKTLFAAALAAECEVPLLRSSYADWEAATGSGNLIAKAIKKAFSEARKKAPCILFIDEMDSVGARGKRGHNSGWFDIVINSLLAELDGAEPRNGVVVVGATNHPDQIDPALLRPGRLDRHVRIPKPTIEDLKAILAHHLGEIDGLDEAARACRGLSPATVAQVAREARRAARKAKRAVGAVDVLDVIAERRGRRDPKLDRRICVHEAGHALVRLRLGFLVSYVDADAGETVIEAPIGAMNLAELETYLAGMMGGRAAEIAVFGEPTSGAVGDLANATSLASAAVAQAGLAGSLIVMPHEAAIAEPDVRRRVEDLMGRAMERAAAIISENRRALDALARALAKRRYLDADEVKVVVRRARRTAKKLRQLKDATDDQPQRS